MTTRNQADLNYVCYIGESYRNGNFPKNTDKLSLCSFVSLFWRVLIDQIKSSYTLYFIIIGILEFAPDVATVNPWMAFLPLFVAIFLDYAFQVKNLISIHKSLKADFDCKYNIIRDHSHTTVRANEIEPGDLIEFNLQTSAPCDCVLIYSDQLDVYINTSKIDGETEPKGKVPLRYPNISHDFFETENATVTAVSPRQSSFCEGQISFSSSTFNSLNYYTAESNSRPSYHIESGHLTALFDSMSFIQRGSVIKTDGKHLLLALYTGKNCSSNTNSSNVVMKKTVIDFYLEKVVMLVFIVQFLISLILGTLGYLSMKAECKFFSESNDTYYIPYAISNCQHNDWIFLILFTRNFLLLSYMVPITLKLLLPFFRFIYGMFISSDPNLVDNEERRAHAFSTNITENLGALDFIITDKTGTLTKNQLTLISITIDDTKYGDVPKAPTLIEDGNLREMLVNQPPPNFAFAFYALSLCHAINIINRDDGNQELRGTSADELAILTALQQLGFKWNDREIISPMGTASMKVVRILPFSQQRMRMSVIAQYGDNYFCFMKGASEKVIAHCREETIGSANQVVSDYQNKGLRTLSVSYKELGPHCNYEAADMAEIESDHTLLATLGIEDTLQNDVQLTLDLLSKAGIKIWVATGDAKANTLVTSAMLNLIHHKEPIVEINTDILNYEDGYSYAFPNDRPVNFSEKALSVPPNSFSCVINSEDKGVLQKALESKKFLRALSLARCAIFYRCKPETKKDIAIALQNYGKRVLAVGDGYNDSYLLGAADVGVGILSPDGTRMYASCDFEIPAFRNLGRLILIHGHQSLHRSVLAVHFSFYKAVMFGVVQSVYQYWTGFSGTSFFGSFELTAFNNIWTLLPMISLLFEKDISDNFLYRDPSLYDKLRNPLKLTPYNLTWFFVALYQGFIVMLISYALTGEAFLNPDGKDYGASYLSFIIYFALVLISLFYMLYQTNTFTYYSIVLIFGTIMLLIASSAFLTSKGNIEMFTKWSGFYGECFNDVRALLFILTIFLAAVSPSWVMLFIFTECKHSDIVQIIEKETNAAKNDVPLFFDPPNDK